MSSSWIFLEANQVSACWLFLCLLLSHFICLRSINTSSKRFTAVTSIGGHTPPVENRFCILRELEICFRLAVIKVACWSESLALSKKRARQSSFFCAFCLRYCVCPSGLHRSVKKSKCILHLSSIEILVARLGGISYGGGAQSQYQRNPPNMAVFLCLKSYALFDSYTCPSLL